MDPNNQNQYNYSIDYLNEIASQPPQKSKKDKLFPFIIGGGVVLVIIAVLLMAFSSGGGPKEKMQTLAARLITLQKISSDTQKNLKSGSLRSTNSNLTIFLTNTNRDIVDPLAKNNIDVKKLDSAITTKEDGSALTQKLEDARLNAVLDRTYASEMTYQLKTVAVLLQEIYDGTNSKSFKDFLEATNTNLQPLIKQLEAFNNTNE